MFPGWTITVISRIWLIAAFATLTVVASRCGSSGNSSAEHHVNRTALKRCVVRWNNDLKRRGNQGAATKSELAKTSVHVDTISARCLVVFTAKGRHVVFLTTRSSPTHRGFDFRYEGATRQTLKPSLRSDNARMDSHDRLTLR